MLAAGVNVLDVAALAIVEPDVSFVGEQIGKTEDRVERGAQLVTHGGKKLVLEPAAALGLFLRTEEFLIGGLEAAVGFLYFRRALVDFRFHSARVRAQLFSNFFLREFLVFETNEFRDVFDAVNDVQNFPVRPYNGGIARAPISL